MTLEPVDVIVVKAAPLVFEALAVVVTNEEVQEPQLDGQFVAVPHGPQPVLAPVNVAHGPHPQPDPPNGPLPFQPLPGPPQAPWPPHPPGGPGRAVEMAEYHGPLAKLGKPVGQALPPEVAENVASGAAATEAPALAHAWAMTA